MLNSVFSFQNSSDCICCDRYANSLLNISQQLGRPQIHKQVTGYKTEQQMGQQGREVELKLVAAPFLK